MANKIDTIERDGRLVHIYDNGMERDAGTGQMVKPPAGVPFTSETAKLARRKRQEKTARLLRERIAEVHSSSMPNLAHTAADAFAEAGAMLYEQVVLNSEAYPRDRKDVYEMLGKYADVLPTDRKDQPEDITASALLKAAVAGANAEAAAVLARVLKDVQRIQENQAAKTVEGKLIE